MSLEKIKADDKVILNNNEILTVDRVAKTLIICGNSRFRKDGGYELGSRTKWQRLNRISTATDSDIKRIKENENRQKMLSKVVNFKNYSKLSTENLESIVDIIKRSNK